MRQGFVVPVPDVDRSSGCRRNLGYDISFTRSSDSAYLDHLVLDGAKIRGGETLRWMELTRRWSFSSFGTLSPGIERFNSAQSYTGLVSYTFYISREYWKAIESGTILQAGAAEEIDTQDLASSIYDHSIYQALEQQSGALQSRRTSGSASIYKRILSELFHGLSGRSDENSGEKP